MKFAFEVADRDEARVQEFIEYSNRGGNVFISTFPGNDAVSILLLSAAPESTASAAVASAPAGKLWRCTVCPSEFDGVTEGEKHFQTEHPVEYQEICQQYPE